MANSQDLPVVPDGGEAPAPADAPAVASADQPAAAPPADPPAGSSSSPADVPAGRGPRRRAEKAPDPLRTTKTSAVYASVVALALVLILLIIFIAQNTRHTIVTFLWMSGQVSVAVALLIAAAAGLLLALLAGSLRILQLRRRVRGLRKAPDLLPKG